MTDLGPKGKKTFRQKMEEKKKNFDPSKVDVDEIERNTFRMSLVILLIGLFCLFNVEIGGSTFYVLMFVFILNAGLITWIIIRRIKKKRQIEQDAARAKAEKAAKEEAKKLAEAEGREIEQTKEEKLDDALDRIMNKK